MPDVQTSWIHIFPWIVCMQQRNLFADSSPVKWWYNFYAFKKPENRTLPSCHTVLHFAAWNSLKNLEMGPLGLWDQCTKSVWERDVFGISWYNLATISLTGKSKQTFTKMSRKWPFLTLMKKNGTKLSLKAMSIVKF